MKSSNYSKNQHILNFILINIGFALGTAVVFTVLGISAIVEKVDQLIPFQITAKQNLDYKEDRKDAFKILLLDETDDFFAYTSSTCKEFVQLFPIFRLTSENKIEIGPGIYTIDETVIIPKNCTTTIAPGTTLRFTQRTSLLSYSPIIAKGTQYLPIVFTAYDISKPWGVLGIVLTHNQTSSFSYIQLEHAKDAQVNGIVFSGGLSAHLADVNIDNSFFRFNQGDDAINVKNSTVVIQNSSIMNNKFDGIDLDVSETSQIRDNQFVNNGNDAIDISFSDVKIARNTIRQSNDKCISVGEQSKPIIEHNTLEHCTIGIAVKDASVAIIKNNSFFKNVTAISVYNKKGIFDGGLAILENNRFDENDKNLDIETGSEIRYQ